MRWDDDRAAYLLGALDAAETAAFEDHLAGCERCRAELRWLAPAVDVLPAAVEQLEPPPALRGRILGAIEAEGGRAPARRSTDRDAAAPSTPRDARGSFWDRLRLPAPALAAIAAAVALAIGLAGGYALRGDDAPDSSGTVATVPLEATGPAIRAAGNVVRHDDTWTLDVSHIPSPRPGDVYQVWMRSGDRLQPSILFVPSRDGTARVVLPSETGSADEMLVTREPAGGSQEPTSAPLVSATL
jgi:anti-sigma-K factor RskA